MKPHKNSFQRDQSRFKFIGHALHGDGNFRPTVFYDKYDRAYDVTESYLVRYPRESLEKYARRNELAFYSSPFFRVVSKFISYVTGKPVQREYNNEIYEQVAENCDGKHNSIDVFWQDFMMESKARGSMMLLIDMPKSIEGTLADQLQERQLPYWTPIFPELVKEYRVGEDGLFDFVEFNGNLTIDGEEEPVIWHFDRDEWWVEDHEEKKLDQGAHPLGVCPIISFTEFGDYPCFGPFSPIADLAKRLFNLDSELDEILRSQTFSILTMQVPEDTTDEQRLEAARAVGDSIGTSNLMMHTGSTPTFIAPDSGPADIYLKRIDQVQQQIKDIGLVVAQPESRESGIAMEMRFHAINSELAKFCVRMEDIERKAWEITAKWLGIDATPDIGWPRDFNIADVEKELMMLESMQRAVMPEAVVDAQQKKIVATQFDGYEQAQMEELFDAIDTENAEARMEVTTDG